MILSASRRTDIPAFYSDWFMNRIRDGFVMVRNPMNYNQVSKISLSPNVVDCIVFWSKNPAPLVSHLDRIRRDYPFFFQFTINGYASDLEPNLPPLDERIRTLIEMSKRYGSESVVWRYDPVMVTDRYTIDWHKKTFSQIASQLKGYTDTCVFSFVDLYEKVKNNLKQIQIEPLSSAGVEIIAEHFAAIASSCDMKLNTCSELIDLGRFGIGHSCCVDRERIEGILGCPVKGKKDPNQRQECACMESVDIGQYNTCLHGCRYCYANYSQSSVKTAVGKHNPLSPLLVGNLEEKDKITERKVKSNKDCQISLF